MTTERLKEIMDGQPYNVPLMTEKECNELSWITVVFPMDSLKFRVFTCTNIEDEKKSKT